MIGTSELDLVASGVAGLLWTLVSPLAAFLFASAGMTVAVATSLARSRSASRARNRQHQPGD